MNTEPVRQMIVAVWAYPGVKVITLGTLLNVVLAVAVALRTGQFSLRVLGEFLARQLLPYVIVYGAFQAASDGTGFEWVASVVLGLICTMLASRMVENLHELGVPIPAQVLALVQRPPVTVSFVPADEVQAQPPAK